MWNEHARGFYPRRSPAHSLATCDLPYPAAFGLLDLLTCLPLAKTARFRSYLYSSANFHVLSYRYCLALHLKSASSPHCRPPRFSGPTPTPVQGLLPGCPVPRRDAGSRRVLPAAPSLPASDDHNETMLADSLTSPQSTLLTQKKKLDEKNKLDDPLTILARRPALFSSRRASLASYLSWLLRCTDDSALHDDLQLLACL